MIRTTFVNGISPFAPRIEEPKPPKRIAIYRSASESSAFALAFIRANPGCTTRALQKAIGRSESMAQKYLSILVREGAIHKVPTIAADTGIVIRYNYWTVQ